MDDISIHAPLAGCDVDGRADRREPDISIHAPLAGCDRTRPSRTHRTADFNPRTPCGVRLCWTSRAAITAKFQSTHPLRGATFATLTLDSGGFISIHAPLAGCDCRWMS